MKKSMKLSFILTKTLFSFLLTLSFLLICNLANAAGPIGHIFFSQEFLFPKMDQMTDKERGKFIKGTLFPDIRYLGGCKREETHFESVNLNEVFNEKDLFLAGMKFHSWVDIERERYVTQSGIYQVIQEYKVAHPETFLKFLEDEILFFQTDLPSILGTQQEEYRFVLEEATLKKWQHVLTIFTTFCPSTILWTFDITRQGFGNVRHDEIAQWNKVFKQAVQDPRIKAYVQGLKFYIFSQISAHKILAP
jgi:hypothetical protein